MTTRTVRRAAAAATLVIASCNVYDPALLVGGGGTGSLGGGGVAGNGGTTGTSGTEAQDGGADNGGTAGTPNNGGSSGSGGVSGTSTGGTDSQGGEPPTMGGDGGTVNDGGAGSGTAGTGGVAGGGNGGVGGSGGSSGGGAGGSGGTSATGCAKLTVPLKATGEKSHYVITLNTNQDLTTGTISLRFYVEAGMGGSILPYVQDPNFAFFARPAAELSTFSGWSVITWDVGAQAVTGNITKNNIKRIGVEITAYPSSTWLNPTIVYLDSITVKTTAFPFDTTATVSTTATSTDQSNQVLWFNSGGSDSTVTGTVAWQASCP